MKLSRRSFLRTSAARRRSLFLPVRPVRRARVAGRSGAGAPPDHGRRPARPHHRHARARVRERGVAARQRLAASGPRHGQSGRESHGDRRGDDGSTVPRDGPEGIDVHVISVHPSQFLYFTEPDLARAHREDAEREDRRARRGAIAIDSSGSATSRCSSPISPSNSSITRSRPLDLRGFIVGANVNGTELANPKLDPFWKKSRGAADRSS